LPIGSTAHGPALTTGHVKKFRKIVVFPTQELQRHLSGGALFRGGPDWPYFQAQVYARHCWKLIPRPVDSRPRRADQPAETADRGIWCGPVSNHFGHMVADFGMRIAASSRLDATTPLVFSISAAAGAEPMPFFWQMIDHFGVDRRRVMLIRKPTRFGELRVVAQAERRFGGGPRRAHLQMMDAIAAASSPAERDLDCVFVSRGLLSRGRFAGETYLDQVFAAAGVTVFHPERVDLQAQLQVYRRARQLIFSEGSAQHALQLLGHVDADIAVLTRRPGNRVAAASLRPRARSLRYIRAARGLVYGVTASGRPQKPSGVSVLDERRFLTGLRALGIDIAALWDPKAYAESRDAEIAAWISYRLASATYPGERATIEKCLNTLSLRHLMP
jgi:hypothetical protein